LTHCKYVFVHRWRWGDWYGLVFQKVAEQSVLDYSIVEYAYDAITIKKSKIQISNCEIRYNYHSGMSIEVKANPKISRNIISENDYAGIICTLGSHPVLTDNLITLNGIGLVILSSSSPNLGRIEGGINQNPGRNRVLQNEEYDIYNHSGNTIFAQNNAWGTEDFSEIGLNLYDQQDNNQFGSIDFNPLFQTEFESEEVDDLLLLSQNIGSNVDTTIPPTSQASTDIQPSLPVTIPNQDINYNPIPLSVSKEQDFENNTDSLDEINSLPIENLQSLENNPVLIASSDLREDPTASSTDVIDQINYNDVFLEAFLDEGKKNYILKSKIRMNELVLRSMQAGVVRIQVIVDKAGNVESATILKGFNKILDQAALSTARNFRYQPGTINNIPVRFRTIEMFVFSSGI